MLMNTTFLGDSFSIKWQSRGEVEDGRFFLEFTEQLVEKILTVNKQLKLEQLWYTEDLNGRKGFRWLNVIFR